MPKVRVPPLVWSDVAHAVIGGVRRGARGHAAARLDWAHEPNFRVIGDVGAGDLRQVTKRLEQFREAIGILFPKAALSTSTPTTVLVFKSHKSYEPLKPLYNGKIRQDIAGYFQATRAVNYVTFTVADGLDQLGIIYHEYVHLIVNNTVDNVPLWFNEGLAETTGRSTSPTTVVRPVSGASSRATSCCSETVSAA